MFNFFKKTKKEPKSLKEVSSSLESLEKDLQKLSQQLKNLEKKSQTFFQKIGIVRFNPFSEVGSNQSFSLALLDENDNGIVITSLYAREGNRIYAKPIRNKQSQYSLSKEEKKALEKAIVENDGDKK